MRAYDGDLLGRLGYSNSDMLERMRYLEPGTSFREKYIYSNAGFFIAGEAAAAVDNRSWEDLTDARIIRPLGMTRSGAHPETLYLDDNHVSGHGGTGGDVHTIPLEKAGFPAAGQVVSTGRDMTQWLRMMLNEGSVDGKQVLTPETVKEIHAASLVAGHGGPLNDLNGAVGLGSDSYNFLGERVIEKNGALDGVRSIVILIPGKKTGLVVIANKQLTVFPEAVRDEFLERYIGKSGVDLQAREKINQAGWNSLIKSVERPADAGPATISPSAIAGIYKSDLYGTMQVEPGPGCREYDLRDRAGQVPRDPHARDKQHLVPVIPEPGRPGRLSYLCNGPVRICHRVYLKRVRPVYTDLTGWTGTSQSIFSLQHGCRHLR